MCTEVEREERHIELLEGLQGGMATELGDGTIYCTPVRGVHCYWMEKDFGKSRNTSTISQRSGINHRLV